MIRVLCVEDDPMVRAALVSLLSNEADIQIVATAASVREALGHLARGVVDVVVLDWVLEGGESGARLLQTLATWGAQQVTSHLPKTLICTGRRHDVLAAARAWGAQGLVDKSQVGADLAGAVRAVASGESWFPAPIPTL